MGMYNDPEYFEKRIKYQRKRRSAVISAIRAHFIRPCYLRESESPMKFYKLIARIGLPLGFILNLFRAMQATTAIGTATEAAKPYFIIDAVYMWVGIVLVLGAVIGLNKMEWYGVKCYASLFGWQIVYSVFLATYSASLELFEFEYFGRNIFAAIFLSVWLYFCMIYFGKRRLLFSPGAFDTPEVPDVVLNPEAFSAQAAPASPDPVPSKPDLPAVIPEKPVKKAAPRALVIGLVVALALSLAGNVWQATEWSSEKKAMASEIKGKEQSIANLKSANSSVKSELSDLRSYRFNTYYSTGYIVNGSTYFHRYDCPVVEAADTYQSHNTEFCKWLGYSGCPVCHSGISVSKIDKTPKQSAP